MLVKDRVVSTLGEGGFFGEIALIFESKRTASIRAKTYCDLSVLRKADLDKVAKSFPGTLEGFIWWQCPEERLQIKQMGEVRISKDSLRAQIEVQLLFNSLPKAFTSQIQAPETVFFVTIWRECSNQRAACRMYVYCVTLVHLLRQEFLYHVGEQSDNIYFIGTGAMDFLDESQQLTKQVRISSYLTEGRFFGFADFLLNTPRKHAAKAAAPCNSSLWTPLTIGIGTVLVLSREDLESVLQEHRPASIESLRPVLETLQLDSICPEFEETDKPKERDTSEQDKKKSEKGKKNKGEKNPQKQEKGKILFKFLNFLTTGKDKEEWITKFTQIMREGKGNLSKEELVAACRNILEALNDAS